MTYAADFFPANSNFFKPQTINIKNEWRRAYMDAVKSASEVWEIRTKSVAIAWDGRMA